jgi:hypothetical protein
VAVVSAIAMLRHLPTWRFLLPRVYDINQFMTVQAGADAEVALDPHRLRYLTENFAGLQGLNFVALGAFFLLSEMEEVYGASWPIRGWWLWLVLPAFVGAIWYAPKYYLQRFGYVEPRNPSNKQVAIFILALLIFFVCRRSLDRYANDLTQVIRSMIADPDGQVKLSPVLLWIVSLSTSLLKRSLRIIERVSFLCFGTIVFAAIALYPYWHPEAMKALLWRTLNAGSFGFSLMALGLYDHISLVRMLPKIGGVSDDE